MRYKQNVNSDKYWLFPVCRESLTLHLRTASREPSGSPRPLVGLGAVRATDRQPLNR